MKESLPKHNSLYWHFRERRLRETNATGVDQEIDNEYYRTNLRRLINICNALDIDMKLFKYKDSRAYNVTDEVKKLFDFLLDDVLEKKKKTYRTPEQISPEKLKNLWCLLRSALQSCNVSGKKIKHQMHSFAQKQKVYVHNKNTHAKYLPRRLPAQYFRGTSLKIVPVVSENDSFLSEEELKSTYGLPSSPSEIQFPG